MKKLVAFSYMVTVNGRSKNVIVIDTDLNSANQYMYTKFGIQNVSGAYSMDGEVIINQSNPEVSSMTQYDMETNVIYY